MKEFDDAINNLKAEFMKEIKALKKENKKLEEKNNKLTEKMKSFVKSLSYTFGGQIKNLEDLTSEVYDNCESYLYED